MIGPRSLQWRLSISLVGGVVLMWALGILITGYLLRSEMNEIFDSAIVQVAQRVLPLAVSDIVEREEEGISQRMAAATRGSELLTYIVRDSKGRPLIRSFDAVESVFPPYVADGFSVTETHRIYSQAALQGDITIAVAEPLSHRTDAIQHAVLGLFAPLLLLIPLSLFGVWWRVRVSLRPVHKLQSEIETRGGNDLAEVSHDALPTEIEPIAQAVNSLLERLRRALDSERSFAANSAHELRTPVAAALAQTQRMIAIAKSDETRQHAEQIETALKRLAALTEKLMQLAKSEGAGLIAGQKGDLAPVLKLVLTDFERAAALYGNIQDRIIVNLPKSPVLAKIDPNAFAILARNLIENALNHGSQDRPIVVTLGRDATLKVVNDSPVVPPKTLKTLTEAFTRGQSQASGSGLGLAIVKAVADGSGSTFALNSPATGKTRGFEAVVKLV
ncbi:MAG: HAMP domain-containing histidine kinase [Alphaproteobacteria bacterium]|nr:HAMP domain-containing histidine kinase [Alphaproteobacteria bacterium]